MTPAPKVALTAVAGTAAYLGPALLGWGGIAAFFSRPALIALAIALTGWALAFRSGVGIPLAVLSIVPVVGRIRAEEALLRCRVRCIPQPDVAADPRTLLANVDPA